MTSADSLLFETSEGYTCLIEQLSDHTIGNSEML